MKKSNAFEPISTILKQIYVENDALFYVKDRPFHVANQSPYQQWNRPLKSFGENPGDDVQRRKQLVSEMTGRIYSTFYVSGNAEGEWMNDQDQPTQQEKNAFMDTLSAANQSVERWDAWWSVTSIDAHGHVTVQKNGATRRLVPHEWQPALPGNAPLAVGAFVSVLVRKEHREMQPVFYYVYSQEFMPQPASLGRFYLHLQPDGVADWVRGITTAFNKLKVPFMFKCLNHPKLYHRSDSAVLYIEKQRFPIAARLLEDLRKTHGHLLRDAIPMFTKRLAPGLAYAEDPGDSRSFGMFWSEIIAEGIVKAWEKGVSGEAEKTKLIQGHIASNGVALESSHLRPNSFYPYNFSLFS